MVGKRLNITRKCKRKECGALFQPWYMEQEVCSGSCRNILRNSEKQVPLVLIKQTCKECGCEFSKPFYAKYCGRSCLATSQCRTRALAADVHEPKFTDETLFDATDAPPGSREKVEILRKRMESGFPLWHSLDRVDFAGLTGQ